MTVVQALVKMGLTRTMTLKKTSPAYWAQSAKLPFSSHLDEHV